MIAQVSNRGFCVDLIMARCAGALRQTARVLDREVVPRLGYPGMTALTLLVFALIQAGLPGWALLGGASLPVLWGAIVYYVLRFRIRRGLVAAFAGSLLSCLAHDAPMLATGGVTLALSLAFLFLGQWLYTEFWPAHALAGGLFVLLIPVTGWILGVPAVHSDPAAFVGMACAAPFVSTAIFATMEWTRRQLDVTILHGDESEPGPAESAGCVQRPSLARGTSV